MGEGENFFEKDILIQNFMAVLMVHVASAFYLTQSRDRGKKRKRVKILLLSSLKKNENSTIRKSAKKPFDSSICFRQNKYFDRFSWLYRDLYEQH